MNHATTCKFCHTPLVLSICDDYSTEFDPFKLLPFAACNRCADLRTRKRTLEDAIAHICAQLAQFRGPAPSSVANVNREALTRVTKKYTAMIAEWVGSSTSWWEEDIVNVICDKPTAWPKTLALCWRMYEDKPKARPVAEPIYQQEVMQ